VVSGYHDTTGDAAINEELAKKRAETVRDVLTGLGVPADKVELQARSGRQFGHQCGSAPRRGQAGGLIPRCTRMKKPGSTGLFHSSLIPCTSELLSHGGFPAERPLP
jgi:hypothetical protein